MLRSKRLNRLFLLSALLLTLLLNNNSQASTVFLNLNNSIYAYISGSYQFMQISTLSRNYLRYQSLDPQNDLISNQDVLYNFSTKKYSDPSYSHQYDTYNTFSLNLGLELEFNSNWYLIARLKSTFADNELNLDPSISIHGEQYGTFLYRGYRVWDSLNVGSDITPPVSLSGLNLDGNYFGYVSPSFNLKNDNSIGFLISTISKPKLSRFWNHFIDSFDYYLNPDDMLIYSSLAGKLKINSNHKLQVEYEHVIKNGHTLHLATSYIVNDYIINTRWSSFDNGDNVKYIASGIREKLFKASIGYEFGTFSAYYIYGSLNATNDGNTIFINYKMAEDTDYYYAINPKLSGSIHSFKAKYSPYFLDNKLTIYGNVDIYNDKVSDAGNPNTLFAIGSNASVDSHHITRYGLELYYQINKHIELKYKTFYHTSNTRYLVTSSGKLTSHENVFFNRFVVETTF